MKAFVTGIACLLALSAGFASADDTNEQADQQLETATEDSTVRAATPSDENQTRIRSIRRNEHYYRSYGRPDLTKALVTGEFMPIVSSDIVDMNVARLVGIVKGATDRFAMLEDGSGNGFIVRVGDKVRNGRITAVTDNSCVASVTLYGMTTRVVLRLENREG